jgi:hypothetical protein
VHGVAVSLFVSVQGIDTGLNSLCVNCCCDDGSLDWNCEFLDHVYYDGTSVKNWCTIGTENVCQSQTLCSDGFNPAVSGWLKGHVKTVSIVATIVVVVQLLVTVMMCYLVGKSASCSVQSEQVSCLSPPFAGRGKRDQEKKELERREVGTEGGQYQHLDGGMAPQHQPKGGYIVGSDVDYA